MLLGYKSSPRRVFPHTHHTYVISTVKVSRQGRSPPPPSNSQTEHCLDQPNASFSRLLTVLAQYLSFFASATVKKLLAKPARVTLCFYIYIFSRASEADQTAAQRALWPPGQNSGKHIAPQS